MSLCILDLGEGWDVARLNDKTEYDFIRQAQRGSSYDRNFFISGQCVGNSCSNGASFDFSNYVVGELGKFNMFNTPYRSFWILLGM